MVGDSSGDIMGAVDGDGAGDPETVACPELGEWGEGVGLSVVSGKTEGKTEGKGVAINGGVLEKEGEGGTVGAPRRRETEGAEDRNGKLARPKTGGVGEEALKNNNPPRVRAEEIRIVSIF